MPGTSSRGDQRARGPSTWWQTCGPARASHQPREPPRSDGNVEIAGGDVNAAASEVPGEGARASNTIPGPHSADQSRSPPFGVPNTAIQPFEQVREASFGSRKTLLAGKGTNAWLRSEERRVGKEWRGRGG